MIHKPLKDQLKMAEQTEKPESDIVFFLGAGASVHAEVPDTFKFVEKFKESETLTPAEKETVKEIEAILIEWLEKTGKEQKDQRVDIELLMETLDKLHRKDDEQLLHFFELKKFKLKGFSEKSRILQQLKQFVKTNAIVPKEKIKYLQPLLGFIQDHGSIDVFTVNYDICLEQFCNVFQKSYRDGFEVEWNPEVFGHPNIDIRLYKIHGSVTWYRTQSGGFAKSMVKSENEQIELVTGEKAESLMLYPMRKWEYAEPLLENLLNLKNKLQSKKCKFVVVIGYSFRDEYIRDIFWDSANKNKDLTLVLIDPKASTIYNEKLLKYKTGFPSSLQSRVVCLPFHFEDVFKGLKNDFLSQLRQGLTQFKGSVEMELRGIDTPYWEGCLKPLVDSYHIEKLEEVINDKLPLEQLVTLQPLLVHEIQLKYILILFALGRDDEALELLQATAKIIFDTFWSNMGIKFKSDQNLLEIYFNVFAPTHSFSMRELEGLYRDANTYSNKAWYKKINTKIEKAKILINDMASYTRLWEEGRKPLDRYLFSRKTLFPNDTNVLSNLLSTIKNEPSKREAIKIEFEDEVMQLERAIVKKILEKCVNFEKLIGF